MFHEESTNEIILISKTGTVNFIGQQQQSWILYAARR